MKPNITSHYVEEHYIIVYYCLASLKILIDLCKTSRFKRFEDSKALDLERVIMCSVEWFDCGLSKSTTR